MESVMTEQPPSGPSLPTLLAALLRYAQVRVVHPTLDLSTIEAGLLTPTLKAKRDVVQGMFAREINALYAEPPRSRFRPN
jgi:hypothetical protein